MRRREFLIVSSMSAALAVTAKAGGREQDAASAVRAAVFEPRYAAAREFARHMEAGGVRVFAANDCAVQLWRGPLADCLNCGDGRLGAARVAGLTLYSDFLLARECARERGLAVLEEVMRPCGSATLVSWLIG